MNKSIENSGILVVMKGRKELQKKLFWAVKVDQQRDHEKELQFAGNLIVYSRTYTDIEVANIMVGYRKK